MKSKKEMVFDYIRQYEHAKNAGSNETAVFTTQELSELLGMQRSNLSTLLNELVKEKRVEKMVGRPVRYRMANRPGGSRREESCFQKLVGQDGSLKNVIKLAKAAILYPEHCLHTLIIGPRGSGKSYFAGLMVEFARENGVLGEEAPFVKFNCRYYEGKESEIDAKLFGRGEAAQMASESALLRARGGVLFIDHIDLLPVHSREILMELVETEKGELSGAIIICAADDTAPKALIDAYSSKFSVRIDLPSLQERRLEERFALVQDFFMKEALRMGKTIKINAEALRCILLYRCELNVKQLKSDIKIGCANAYVRDFDLDNHELCIFMNDFPGHVRKGFLYYKDRQQEVESLIPQNYSYAFSRENMEKVEAFTALQKDSSETIYDVIDRKVEELRERGIREEDISTIINADLEYDLKRVTRRLDRGDVNKESILKIVDRRIVNMVEKFLNEASKQFERVYSESTFYGLCLHLSATLERANKGQQLSNDQIMEIVERYRDEYALCMRFAAELEKEFDIRLPIDEVVFITMFICDNSTRERAVKRPVVLVAMHGNTTASSVAEVVNSLMRCSNTYAFDMALEKDMQTAYDELKATIQEIDEGKGILMLYDMGSFKDMADSIARETGISIRSLSVPGTLIALDCSRKASSMISLEELYESVINSYQAAFAQVLESYERQTNHKVIITLCMSGRGGAVQMKNYLEKHMTLDNIDVLPLAISDHAYLLEEINRIKQNHEILYVIGTYNPHLYGIPFISISRLFETPADKLDMLLTIDSIAREPSVDYNAIYGYLMEQLPELDIRKLKKLLPRAIARIKKSAQGLSQDQELGLFVHIACMIHRIQAGQKMPINVNREKILSRSKRMYNDLRDILRPLEEEFEVMISDDEMANIISIIKQM